MAASCERSVPAPTAAASAMVWRYAAGSQGAPAVQGLVAAAPAWLWRLLATIAAAALRIVPWLANYPLHRDEALYGAWARLIACGRDPLLLTAWVDKPPLVLYLLAGSLRAFGVSVLALRLPGVVAGILILPLVFGLARRAAGPVVAWLATALVATSPFGILFAPTAFTDPWLTLWLVAAAWAALGRRPFWAGLTLGLAVASKQTGVAGAPLVMALVLVAEAAAPARPGRAGRLNRAWATVVRPLLLCLLGVGVVFAGVYWWDSLRWAKRPSFWGRSVETYGGLYLADPGQWGDRAARWAEQAGYLFGRPILTLPILLLAAWGIAEATIRRRTPELVLAVWIVGYAAAHFFVTVQPWDRYLLPLLPAVAILAARGACAVWERLGKAAGQGRPRQLPGAAMLAFALAASAWLGVSARVPVGSDHSAYAGLEQAVATLDTLAGRSIIYHRSLGWQLDFYLFDHPQQRIWWSGVETLAEDAYDASAGDPDRPQWLVLAWAADEPVAADARAALAQHGLRLDERQVIRRADGSPSFTLYEILPTPEGSR